MNHQSTDNKSNETKKAEQLIDKDMPNVDENTDHKGAHHQEPKPFRPDENVDNQKAEGSPSSPAHNTSIKETPIPGAQLAKEKKMHKDNIDQKSAKADPKGSE